MTIISRFYILFERDNVNLSPYTTTPTQNTCIPKLGTTYRSTCYQKLMPRLKKKTRSFKVLARKVTAI